MGKRGGQLEVHRLASSCLDRSAAEALLEKRFGQAPEDLDGDPPASRR